MAKLITFFLFLLIAQIYPQDSVSAKNESEFRHAVDLYQSHQYEQALKIFEKMTEGKNKDGNASASFLFKGKILAETKKYSEAENVLYEFLQQYPSRHRIPEVEQVQNILFCVQIQDKYMLAKEMKGSSINISV